MRTGSRRRLPRRAPTPGAGPAAAAALAAAVAALGAASLAAAPAAASPGPHGARQAGGVRDERPARRDTAQEEDPFPHGEHAGLFPVCTGCHEGAESGAPGEMHPDPSLCVKCHDGEEEDLVFWRGPRERPTTLEFDHLDHAREVASEGRREEPIACAGCHRREGAARMDVERAVAGRCLDCHAHEAEEHYVDAACSTCHRPLAESRLPRERIAGLPVPATHDRPDFLARVHGERAEQVLSRCTVCHTRERCTGCHVDAEDRETITAMAPAPDGMELPASEARYPTPETHERDDFLETHGRDLEPAECSTCHTRESCTTCHVESETPAADGLPRGREVRAPGASVERREPESHRSPYFVEDHEAAAAASGGSCAACHAPSSCTECHQEEREPGYHPPNFALQHSSRAYGQAMECANCHDNSVFCRDCHTQLGMGTGGRLGSGFHDGTAAWLFRHAQAARQALESCTTCHEQRDCLQCHSERGAFRVSPHGPGFDARRLFEKNPQICFACHISDPLGETRP